MNITKSVIQNALKKAFSPEFLNRIDDVVIFNTLTREDIHKIIDIELKGLVCQDPYHGLSHQDVGSSQGFYCRKRI